MKSKFVNSCFLLLLTVLFVSLADTSFAVERTFGKGSYILPADSCWQPNNDKTVVSNTDCYINGNKNSQITKDDKSIFQVYGLLYALLDTGDQAGTCKNNDGSDSQQKSVFGFCKPIKVYWIIDSEKTSTQTADLILTSTDSSVNSAGLVTIYKGTNATNRAGSTTQTVQYKGGPFVIDGNDLTNDEFNKIKAKFPAANIHKSNIAFTGNVDKVLIGKPPKIAVLNEGNSDILENYIRAAGLYAWKGTVFQYVSAREIIAGCLQDPIPSSCKAIRPDIVAPFQLLWAPHWEIETKWKGESNVATPVDQTKVIQEIRDFMERGNSGFFECASIGSMEAAVREGTTRMGMSVDAGVGGFLVDKEKAKPRIDVNGGCGWKFNSTSATGSNSCGKDYLVYEQAPFWLMQCGGWDYQPTGGYVDSMRPKIEFTKDRSGKLSGISTENFYHSTEETGQSRFIGTQLTRFMHDKPGSAVRAKYDTGYPTANPENHYHVYDYLVGGRINGAPNQGYVIYFPGHNYITCKNASSYADPPRRTIDLQFDAPPSTTEKITIKAVHAKCSSSLATCPVVEYDLATGIGSVSADNWVSLTTEFAEYDQATNRLNGVAFSSTFVDATTDSSNGLNSLAVNRFEVTFDGDNGSSKLVEIVDTTQAGEFEVLCSPKKTSNYPITSNNTVTCNVAQSSLPETRISLLFDGDIKTGANPQIKISLANNNYATLRLDTNVSTKIAPNTSNIEVDLSKAVYDEEKFILNNVLLKRISKTSCAELNISDFKAEFPGTAKLISVVNNSFNVINALNTPLCEPDSKSPASCKTGNSGWSYSLGQAICGYRLAPYLSSCNIDWSWNSTYRSYNSNTCGTKYILNTFLALKFQTVSSEFVKTQPIVKDNILYKASYDYPAYRGHLRMIKVPTGKTAAATTVWDAANNMPVAGTSGFKDQPLASTDTSSPRFIFTTQPGSTIQIPFDTRKISELKSYLGTSTDNATRVLINTVRGRMNASETDSFGGTTACSNQPDGIIDLDGCAEDPKRLWALETSTPALKTISKLVEKTSVPNQGEVNAGYDRRDRILFAGASDGMLHAFWAGTYDPNTSSYPDNTLGQGNGKEIWAYIPSALLPVLKDQPFNPDPTNESTFEPKVAVNGSPALGDFLICTEEDAKGCKKYQWQTRLVGTATIASQNRGIVFALDVTNPYKPKVLWENSYDKTGDTSCKADKKNCNMGNSKGVAIGTTQVGSKLHDYVFLTSSWIKKKKVKMSGGSPVLNPTTKEATYEVCGENDNSTSCVYGINAYALDINTGNVQWVRELPYTGTAVGINETPAVPALMDRDNNGSYDYVVFGDMQGRVWALRTTDGKNLTDIYESASHTMKPVYQVKELDSNGYDKSETDFTNEKEPIGAPVGVYRDYVILATGGADFATDGSEEDSTAYRIEIIKLGGSGGVKQENQTVVLTPYNKQEQKKTEKVWAQPLITSDLKVYVGTARSFYSSQADVSSLQSDGRIIVIDLKAKRADGVTPKTVFTVSEGSNVMVVGGKNNQWHSGGFVGGLDADRKHVYAIALKPEQGSVMGGLQIGDDKDFSPTVTKSNPFKILWWRKL